MRHIDALREAVRETRRQRPFHIDAWVVLPDHLHCVWTLPSGDDDFSNRWKAIKIRFVQALPQTERRSKVRMAKGERGIWQRRFWEHLIRDEKDYANHVDYIHYNPVKHGHVSRVIDWPYSTFHGYLRNGVYNQDWGTGDVLPYCKIGDRPRFFWLSETKSANKCIQATASHLAVLVNSSYVQRLAAPGAGVRAIKSGRSGRRWRRCKYTYHRIYTPRGLSG